MRWKFKANGPISGSAIVINGVVYFSSFKGRTYALDARTGKLLWFFRRGKYGAVVADREWLYLVGYARVFAMAPRAAGKVAPMSAGSTELIRERRRRLCRRRKRAI